MLVFNLSVQHFMPVLQEVHEEHPELFGAGTKAMMDAQRFCGSHLEAPSQKNSEFTAASPFHRNI